MNKTTIIEAVTIEKMREFSDAHQAFAWARSHQVPYPQRPKKPMSAKMETSFDVEGLLQRMKEYEGKMAIYDIEFKQVEANNQHISNIISEFYEEESGIVNIPSEYREKAHTAIYELGGHMSLEDKLRVAQEITNIFR